MELLVHDFCSVVTDVRHSEVANDLVLAEGDNHGVDASSGGPMYYPHSQTPLRLNLTS